jgi:hypothetical protein
MAARTSRNLEHLCCVFLVAVLTGCATRESTQTSTNPFIGTWSCEVSEFTFSQTQYRVGTGQAVRIKEVERSGDDFRITLEDGYAFSLFDVAAKTMTWHSMETGDTFACKRIM